ncbi:MAG: prepilin-type N-terminal cleavage/methylation domain-containing protein [Desulfobacterales bacterium]|nr:prepilin-type N-terminal cleavage/methylation domain-containing protein [Desulfobacterales bacterium]
MSIRSQLTRLTKNTALGFTLLEVLVAVCVLAIVMTAIIRMHSQSLSIAMTVSFETDALFLAQKKLSEIENEITRGENNSDQGNFAEPYAGYSWKIEIQDVESTVLDNYSKYLKQLDLTITDKGDKHSFHVRKYMLQQQQHE